VTLSVRVTSNAAADLRLSGDPAALAAVIERPGAG
jgi:hypothetical protein